jgi:DNA invertase Pin-like site-specific DNA recombinase
MHRAALSPRMSSLIDQPVRRLSSEHQLGHTGLRRTLAAVAEFTDQKSGKSLDRPGLKKMMALPLRREFDTLVFWEAE